MRAFFVLLALAVGVVLPGSALSAAGGSDRPVKGSFTGTATLNLLTGQTDAVGSGTGSHVGLATVEEHSQLVPTGETTFSRSGTWTGTAANGDQIFATSTGTLTFTDATHAIAVVTYTVTGGTGRFADATGTMTATVHATVDSVVGGISTISWEGTVTATLSY
jgi:hypothetical protein